MVLAIALTNGSHGMGFAHKFALALPVLAVNILKFTACNDEHALAAALIEFGTFVAGSVATHMAELNLRHSYAVEEDMHTHTPLTAIPVGIPVSSQVLLVNN